MHYADEATATCSCSCRVWGEAVECFTVNPFVTKVSKHPGGKQHPHFTGRLTATSGWFNMALLVASVVWRERLQPPQRRNQGRVAAPGALPGGRQDHQQYQEGPAEGAAERDKVRSGAAARSSTLRLCFSTPAIWGNLGPGGLGRQMLLSVPVSRKEMDSEPS
ncbi:hypothetical protein HJG60_011712 [Phyllostomus discolor]|uniref:Uncharacterized protein n=1 Tax=Phyllostomus discolor TaxID=89673 RepID=A0A834E1E1_9CHIR|nr:hypothetical protein HJG60_011712 [Phyllostomus discolor]